MNLKKINTTNWLLIGMILLIIGLLFITQNIERSSGSKSGVIKNQYPFSLLKEAKLKMIDPDLADIKQAYDLIWNDDSKIFQLAMKNPGNTDRVGLIEKIVKADTNHDNKEETYILSEGQLVINQEGAEIWRSSSEWWVDKFIIADSTNDGVEDINLSVWKEGNYGSNPPFWEEENDQSTKNHFFVFEFRHGKISPVWQSSNLEDPNCDFSISDIDQDNKMDLVVIEGSYEDWPYCQGQYVAVWKWNDWGFANEWRSQKSRFDQLKIDNDKSMVEVYTLSK